MIYYLERKTQSKLPSQKFYLHEINPENLTSMRNSISDAAKNSFSLEPYKKRIETLCSIFNVQKDSELDKEMKKHVEIRNIFQHNRGLIRPSDLKKIGKNYFEILQENGRKEQYKNGQTMILTLPEVESLKEIIKLYSEKFEVLS